MATTSNNAVMEYKPQDKMEARGLASCALIGCGLRWPWWEGGAGHNFPGKCDDTRHSHSWRGCTGPSKRVEVHHSAYYRLGLNRVTLTSCFNTSSGFNYSHRVT